MSGSLTHDILTSDNSLPSLTEIESGGKLLAVQGNTRILLLPNGRVVKYGPTVRIEEAATLRFINQHTNVLAPRLYGVRIQIGKVFDEDGDTGEQRPQTCIFMSYIPGDPLSRLLPNMDDSTISQIISEVKDQVKILRSLNDEGYIGSINRGVCLDPLFRPGGKGGYGPFESERDMNDFLVENQYKQSSSRKYHMRKAMNSRMHKILFTHGDLVPRNIIVKDGHLSGIVDWQNAGWYPEYWEFVRAICTHTPEDAWHENINKIVTPDYCHWLLYLRLQE